MKKILTLALICGLITLAMPSKAEAGIEGRYNSFVALNALNNVAAAHLASSLVTSPAHNYAYMAANRGFYQPRFQPNVYYNSYSNGNFGYGYPNYSDYGYSLGASIGYGAGCGFNVCGFSQQAFNGLPSSYYLGFQAPAYGYYNGGSYYAPRYDYRYDNRQIQKSVVKNYFNDTRSNTTYGGDYSYNATTKYGSANDSYYYNGTPSYGSTGDSYSYNGKASSYSYPSSNGYSYNGVTSRANNYDNYSYNGVTSVPEYSYNATVTSPAYTYNGVSSTAGDGYSYNATVNR